MIPLEQNVTEQQAAQAMRMYCKAHWTLKDTGEMFDWSAGKTRRIIKLYENRKRFEDMGLRVFAV